MTISDISDISGTVLDNPLDTLEQVALHQDWSFDRPGESEMDFVIGGLWSDYALSLNWRDDLEVLHLAAEVDVRVSPAKRSGIVDLIALINEQLFVGHFDLWSEEGVLLYRHGLMLQGGAQTTRHQCEELVSAAVSACDRFYPAFQYHIWGGRPANEALAAALFETQGHA